MEFSKYWLLFGFVLLIGLTLLDDSEVVRKSSIIILIFISIAISRIEALHEKLETLNKSRSGQ